MEQDGIANVLKEAMATGLAPIITDHGGNSEIVYNGKTGFIIPEKDVDLLAAKIIYMIERVNMRTLMGKKASRFINKNFCASKLNKELLEIIRELLHYK
jgi:colanic acid/amylovoran biosynthesis glycosyltransferase